MTDEFEQEKIRRLQRAMYSRSLSKRLGKRPRRELKPLTASISSDWDTKEEGAPKTSTAPRGITAARSVMTWVLGLAVAFFLVSAGIFGYYFTVGPGGLVAAPGNIDISVLGPLSLVGGEPAELQVTVVNRNNTALELADLVIEYPEGTRSPSDFVTNLPRQRISLGEIEPGGTRRGTVSAVFVGVEGERKNIHVELEYRVSDSNAIFVSKTDYELSFTAAPVSISIEANDEVISGQRVAITATVNSNVDTVLKDVLLEAQVPFGFTLESSDPESVEDGTLLWELGDMRPGDTYSLLIRGTMEGQESDERVFRFTAGTRKDKTSEKIDVALANGAHHVSIARPFIGLTLAMNTQGSGDIASALPGETVNVNVSWVNNLSTSITDAVLVAGLSGFEINGRSVRSNDGFYRSTDKTVLWDKSTTNGELARLSPGQRGSYSFSFDIPSEADAIDLRNAALTVTLHAAGKRVSQSGVPETLQASTKKELKLSSNVQFVAQGFYYQNPFGSVGPLPPKVDTETTYAVVFTVANTSNRIQDAKLTAKLPPYVRWIGVYSPAGEHLSFNAQAGTIEWNVGTIAAGTGVGGTAPRQVAFAIGFTPSSSQVGQEPDLIRDMRLTGTDSFTNGQVSRSHGPVTTSLLDDPGFSTTESQVVE